MIAAARRSLLALAVAAATLTAPAHLAAQMPEERDWSEALRSDAQALHDMLAEHHPGQVDDQNPGFARNNAEQLALALERAESAETFGDYYYALRIYVSSFNDGHLSLGSRGNTPSNFQWPGFAANYDKAGDIRITFASERSPVPVDARLVSCDGMSASEYSEATTGTIWGRWSLESVRRQLGRYLFFDESSGYVPTAKRCVFEHAGGQWDVALDWQPIAVQRMFEILRSEPSSRPSFTSKITQSGLRWFSMPSFNGEPSSQAAAELNKMLAEMRTDRGELSDAIAVVLDLRGNGGGSSDWSYQMAKVLWGEAAIAALPKKDHYAEWRVSQANLDHLVSAYERWREGGNVNPEVVRYFESAIDGIGAGLESGAALWGEPDYDDANADLLDVNNSKPPIEAPIYVLTDGRCMSACLDAMDLWLELGAIHVGLPTSADTFYMEVRRYTLPSGVVGGVLPLKVHRGRARGSNEALRPVHRFDGEMTDDQAVEDWVSQLVLAQ